MLKETHLRILGAQNQVLYDQTSSLISFGSEKEQSLPHPNISLWDIDYLKKRKTQEETMTLPLTA